MRIFTKNTPPEGPTAVAMGLFDGLHPGHCSVIRKAVEEAPSLIPVVFTIEFDQPDQITKPHYARILTRERKLTLLSEMGVKGIYSPLFSQIRNLPAEDFFSEILVGTLHAGMLCCGYDYHFGKNASGDSELLRRLCAEAGIRFCQLPALEDDTAPISSTRIREAVRRGNMAAAKNLMGRPYAIDYTVVHGRHLGHDVLGFPTINQIFEPGDLLPLFGVYETRVSIDGQIFKGVTNVGIKPTLGGEQPSAETYILHYDGDLYGRKPLVSFCRYLRGEMKFGSLDELKNQIHRDAQKVDSEISSCF